MEQMNRILWTTYGELTLMSASLHGSAVLYTTKPQVIPAGTRYGAGKRVLKKEILLRPGTILMPRLEEAEGRFLWSIHRYGLHDAIRAVIHTRDGYEVGRHGKFGEIRDIVGVRDALGDLLGWLAAGTSRLSHKQRLAIRAFLAEQVGLVGQVRDIRKQRALEHMLAAVHEKDRLGRMNVSRRMAIVVGARNDLWQRLRLIWFINPRIGTRAVALALEAERIKHVFVQSFKAIGRTRFIMGSVPPQRIVDELDVVIADLQTVRVGPYPAHTERLVRDLRRVQELVKDRSRPTEEACVLLDIVTESLRCKRARWDLEELIMRISAMVHRHTRPDPLECQAIAKEIKEFREKVVANINDTGFEKPVSAKVGMLLALARQCAERNCMDRAKDHVIAAARLL